jgi:HEAT repeat protein
LGKNDVWMRYTILEALSMIGQPVPMAVITPMVGENLLKKAAFDCLGAIGEAEAVPLLLEGLKERVKNIREAAVVALMKVRERLPEQTAKVLVDENLAACNGAPFVEGLLISLDTSDRCLKETLIKVLGIIGDERGIEGLLQSFRDDRLRKQCLLAFKSMGEQAAAALIRIFPGADDDERSSIAYLCGELRFRGSVQILREGLRDSDPVLRRVSVKAAAKAGFSSLIKEIGPLLDDKEPEVREGAVEALSSLAAEDRDAVQKIAGELASAELPEKRCNAAVLFASLADADKLSLLIKDDDAKVRKTAVHSLAALKKESCVGLLVMALADESADVRIAAAGALGEIGGADLLEPLLLAMKDDDARVKCAALKSLGKLHYVGARRAIKDLLASATDGLVTISALKSLAEIDGEESLALVRNALAHPDEEVVKAAIEILSLKGDAWLEDYRESLLAHPHWDVRRSFIKVMVANQGGKALPYLKTVLVAEKDDLVRGQILEILDRYQ